MDDLMFTLWPEPTRRRTISRAQMQKEGNDIYSVEFEDLRTSASKFSSLAAFFATWCKVERQYLDCGL
jgi:hypothetical protein